MIAVNLSSAFHAMRAAIPGMKARGWGRIVSTASAHSKVASPFKSAYVAAKHGLDGLTKIRRPRTRWERGDRELCQSWLCLDAIGGESDTRTPCAPGGSHAIRSSRTCCSKPSRPRQFVTPEAVAAFVVFLCSPAADQITGANLVHRRRLDRGVSDATRHTARRASSPCRGQRARSWPACTTSMSSACRRLGRALDDR